MSTPTCHYNFPFYVPPLALRLGARMWQIRKRRKKKQNQRNIFPFQPSGSGKDWNGMENMELSLIAEKLMNVRILHVVTCIPPGRERLGIMWPRVTGSRSLHHLLDW